MTRARRVFAPISAFSLVAGLLAAFAVVATPTAAQAAPGDPFNPADPYVFVGQDVPSRLYKAVTNANGTVVFQPEGPVSGMTYNALSYNTADNYIYGIVNTSGGTFPVGSLIRIGQGGVVTRVGTQTYGSRITGAFGPSNALYVGAGTAGSELTRINVVTGNVLGSVNLSAAHGADFTFKDGYFWSLGGGQIYRTDPASGVVTEFPFVGSPGPAGAAWTFGNGNLGFSSNGPGTVTQVAVTNPGSANPTFTLVSTSPGPASSNNDGAASPGLPTDLEIEKSAPSRFQAGGELSYTLTVTNNGAGNSSGYVVTDELPAGLTNAATASPGCSITDDVLTCSGGRLLAGASVDITITGDTPADSAACLTNTASVLANEADPAAGNNEASVTSCPQQLSIEKTSTATVDTRVGDTVDYTVTVTNTGAVDYPVDNPAVVLDDLSGVLDDATFNDDAAASVGDDPSYEAPLLSWTGPLAVGASVELTYSATVTSGGDGSVLNAAFVPPCDITAVDCVPEPPAQCVDGVDPATGLACATNTFELPSLAIAKSASVAELPAVGDTVTYTVVATNDGPGDYTVNAPAYVVDDLTEVLDDVTFDESTLTATPAGGELSYDEPRINWSGALASGDSVTLEYEVTYTGEGDFELVNVAFGPQDPDDPTPVCSPGSLVPCDEVSVPGASLDVSKSVDPASGTVVAAGDELTYTLTFDNEGLAAAEVDWTDYLAGVLDDAELTTPPTSDELTVTAVGADAYSFTGSVPAGESITVTYVATVGADGDRGDNVLGNFLVPEGEEPPAPGAECAAESVLCTSNAVPEIVDSKSVDPESGATVAEGDELTYTLTFTNEGAAAGSVDRVDDLTHVLDDAEITSAPQASDDALTVSLDDDRLAVTGDLEPGQTVTVTYTVTVNAEGDLQLGNFLLDPTDDTPDDPSECADDSTDCTYNPVSVMTDSKSVDPESGSTVVAGDELTYTLTFSNEGNGVGTVSRVDDLTHLLDDAEVISGPESSDPALEVSAIADGRFSVDGELSGDQTVTVTYTVQVKALGEQGDLQLGNFLLDPDEDTPPEPVCEDGSTDCTSNRVGQPDIVDSKIVNPASGTTVVAGDELTYVLSFANNGDAPGPVDRVDDLTHVLDDATITTDAVATDDALDLSLDGDRLAVTGELAAGQSVTVTYTVTVNADGERGDDVLGNFLLDPDTDTPSEPVCEDDSTDCTSNPVSQIEDSKSVDPSTGSTVVSGQELTYTLTFTNEGQGQGVVDRVDDLTHVLDDATIVGAPTSSDDSFEVSDITDGRLSITGTVAGGETVTVTYTVLVNDVADLGDQVLGNFLLDPDEGTPSEPVCEEGSTDCTYNPVSDIVAEKSVDPSTGSTVKEGQELTYTLRFTNLGEGLGVVDFTDHMGGVLDDAKLVDGPDVSADSLSASDIEDGAVRITGELAAGESVSVTYVVEVKDYDDQGDHTLGNFLTMTGEEPPTVCVEGSVLCTQNPVEEPKGPIAFLPNTGAAQIGTPLALGLILLAAGAAIVGARRRRVVAGQPEGFDQLM